MKYLVFRLKADLTVYADFMFVENIMSKPIHCLVVGARWAGQSITESPDLLGTSCTTILSVWSEKVNFSCERQFCALLMPEVRGEWPD